MLENVNTHSLWDRINSCLPLALGLAIAALPEPALATVGSNGQPAIIAPGQQQFPAVSVDGSGRTLLAWVDSHGTNDRTVSLMLRESDDRLAIGWDPLGQPLNAPGMDSRPPRLVRIANDWTLCVWTDRAPGSSWRVRGLWLDTREASVPPPDTSSAFVIAPSAGDASLSFATAADDSSGIVAISQTDSLGHLFSRLVVLSPPTTAPSPTERGFVLSDPARSIALSDLAVTANGEIYAATHSTTGSFRAAISKREPGGTLASGWPDSGATIPTSFAPARIRLGAMHGGTCFATWTEPDSSGTTRLHATVFDTTAQYVSSTPATIGSTGGQSQPQIKVLPSGDAIIVALDDRGGGDRLFAWGLTTGAGTIPGWDPMGLALGPGGGVLVSDFQIDLDGNHDVVVTWAQPGGTVPFEDDVFISAINASGEVPAPYLAAGTLVCAAPGVQFQVCGATSPASGRPHLAWTDARNGTFDVYFARIGPDGTVPTRHKWSCLRWTLQERSLTLEWNAPGLLTQDFRVLRALDDGPEGPVEPRRLIAGSERLVLTDALPDGCRRASYRLFAPGDDLLGRVELTLVPAPQLTLLSATGARHARLRIDCGPARRALALQVLDPQGRRVFRQSLPANDGAEPLLVEIPSAAWPSGIYFAQLFEISYSGTPSQQRILIIR